MDSINNDKASFLACISSKICYLDGRVYHRNMKTKLHGSIWGRENVINVIHGFLLQKQNPEVDMMDDS